MKEFSLSTECGGPRAEGDAGEQGRQDGPVGLHQSQGKSAVRCTPLCNLVYEGWKNPEMS